MEDGLCRKVQMKSSSSYTEYYGAAEPPVRCGEIYKTSAMIADVAKKQKKTRVEKLEKEL